MKRRNFIYASALGILSTTKLYAVSHWNFSNSQAYLLKRLLNKLRVKKQNIAFISDDILQAAYNKSMKSWIGAGFQGDDSFYYCREGKTALFPVSLKHQDVGIIDTSLLCFEQTVDGQWHVLSSVSAFHIEAFTKFIEEADSKEISYEWAEILLPTMAKKSAFIPFGYYTSQGEVTLIANINANVTKTDVKITSQNTILWEKKYESALYKSNDSLFA